MAELLYVIQQQTPCENSKLDRSQNISLHFICITFHLHYITFAFKNRAMSARNA